MNDQDLGWELRRARRKHQMSRQQLAEAVGYTAHSVKAWELGTRRIPPTVYKKIVAVLSQQEEEMRVLRRAFRGITPW
jgi:DNA-binding transcriptional regulator YiaG